MSGINVVMSYGGEIVSAIAPSLRSVMPAVLMLFYLLASVVSVILLKKYGRKALTIYGTVGLFITLYVIAFAYFIASTYTALSQVLIVICLFVYLLVYGLTYAPVMWIWVS
jgi:MFS family permease